ncbi:hypothetical protein ACJRO7_030203 [Eucalyptus globulus]|uniref:BHLH domain-containing protein n=1 Tax=Eucalyptus globulus TaxID=34317 RepID=A0ABD3JDB9_EUCGL
MSGLVPVDDGDEFPVPFSTRVEDEIMELLWEDGRPVVQSQRPAMTRAAAIAAGGGGGGGEVRQGERRRRHRLFVQEDEVDSWLQYPFDVFNGGGFCSHLPRSPAPCVTSSSDAGCDFGTSDSGEVTSENAASAGSALVPKAAIGELSPSVSNESTAAEPKGTTPQASSGGVRGHVRRERASGAAVDAPPGGGGGVGGEEGVARDETMVTSPPVGSATTGMGRLAPAGAAPQVGMQREKRKREGRDAGDGEWLSDEKDVLFESADAKERGAKSTPAERSRRTNVHNLSGRRRGDRISRKMKALQELIPQCTKADKASLLDKAIEYLKSLQLQVQMMSMGCSMVPVVFPGVQAYMPCMNMDTATNVGMNPPTMLYPNILASSLMQLSANGVHLSPGWPFSNFSMQQETPDQFRTPPPNHLDPTLSSKMIQNLSQRFQANAGSFQQQQGLYYMQQPPQ